MEGDSVGMVMVETGDSNRSIDRSIDPPIDRWIDRSRDGRLSVWGMWRQESDSASQANETKLRNDLMKKYARPMMGFFGEQGKRGDPHHL